MKNLFKILLLISLLFSQSDTDKDNVTYFNYSVEDFDKILTKQKIFKEIDKYENGNLKKIGYYKKPGLGREYLKSFKYYENGLIKGETVYNPNGYGGCSLKTYEYFDNGVMKSYSYHEPRYEDNFIHCEMNGMDYLYHESGNVKRETMWENHTFIWEKYYSTDGILEYEINKGKHIYYNKDGSIKSIH